MILIKNPEDLEQYFDEKSSTYNLFSYSDIFGELPTVHFECDIAVTSNILAPVIYAGACNIKCGDLTCYDIAAHSIRCRNLIANSGSIHAYDIYADNIIADFDITACRIKADSIQASEIVAKEIRYYSVCCTEDDLKCESIFPQWDTSKHFSLRGDVIINWGRENLNGNN